MIGLVQMKDMVSMEVWGSIEIRSNLVFERKREGFGGKSIFDWGHIARLWIVGLVILDWRKVISLFMILTFFDLLLVAHILN